MRALVAEDDRALRSVLERGLKEDGYGARLARLRAKLGHPRARIGTVPGVGYRVVPG
jgi:DNA-binding response OmpR family regulator